ncbi:LRR and PYD domains-containing 2-like isoform X4 [Octopus vulgaris]|nr:LRR and PYD domains-containing 2-like isoform X4 [Octopus vulgaris]
MTHRGSPPTTHAPTWKFWRRLSSRRNANDKKGGDRGEYGGSLLVSHSDGRGRRECILKETIRLSNGVSNEEDDHLEDLPDVLDNNALRRSQSLKPPPKPPRLFLMRSTSITNHRNSITPSSSRNSFLMSPSTNSKEEAIIKFPINIENGRFLNNSPYNGTIPSPKNPEAVGQMTPDLTTKSIRREKRIKYSANGNPMRIKMDLPASGQLQNARDKITRHGIILHCLTDLLCQRLRPVDLIENMYKEHVITTGDLQAFHGHPDQRLVCESLVNNVSRGDSQQYESFCNVLRNTDGYRDISDILDAMTRISFMISDIPSSDQEDNVLADETTMKFDVGFYDDSIRQLKPVVELERIKDVNGKWGLHNSNSCSSQISSSFLSKDQQNNTTDINGNGKTNLVPMMTVSILGHNLQGKRAMVLAEVLHRYNCILELCLGKTQLTGSDIGLLSIPLQKNNSLTVLDVRLNNIGNEGATMIGNALEQNSTLRQLNLSSTGMDGAGCKRICDALKHNVALEDLDFSFVEIDDEGCVHIAEMLRQNKALKKLRLRSSSITWSGCKFLFSSLVCNTTLTDLDMSRNFIGNEGVDIISQHLAKESCIKKLNLENCGLTAFGCEPLCCSLLNNSCLLNLDLSNNFIGDSGARKLSKAIEENTTLRCFGLNMCEITNDGFSSILDALEGNKTLHVLKLCYNRLGRDSSNPEANSENLRYRIKIVTSSRPKLKLLLWGNTFEES